MVTFIFLNIAFSAEDSDLSGVYFGGSPCLTKALVKYSFENTNLVQGPAMYSALDLQRKFQSDAGKESAALEAFAGFRSRIGKGKAYVGGEIYLGINPSKVTPYDDSASGIATGLFKAEVGRNIYGGLAAFFGYEIAKNTLAYARLGIETSEWNIK